MVIIISLTVLALALIAAYTMLQHREFRQKEHVSIFARKAVNKDTAGDQNHTVIQESFPDITKLFKDPTFDE